MGWWGEKQDAAAREGHPAPPPLAPGVLSALLGGVLSVAVAGLLLLAPAAFALPPANDNFAEAKDFGSTFPLTTVFSNVEATEEVGDPHVTLSPPEHSVWFRWEAPSDGAVAVDTCRSEFATTLAVFSGSTLNGLTEIGVDTNVDGRYCADATGVGFHAVAGTVYSIMVAGNGFHFPEAPAPTTQGSFELRLASIPLPPNDDFANPKPMGPSVTTFIGEAFSSYATWSDGFTWNATKESGEPNHAGDPGGASVWYRWIAPRSGPTEVGACASPNVLLGVYMGNAVNALAEVPLESRPMSCIVNFDAIANAVYRIAVDGRRDTGTGLPEMMSFGINVSMHPPSLPKADAATQRETSPPDTKLFVRVLRRERPIYVFHFSSNEPGSTFRCKRDKHRFAKCHSPKRLRRLKPGAHTVKVFAVDRTGTADPSPAVARFTVPSNTRSHSRR